EHDVRIDQVNVRDRTLELLQKLHLAAGQSLLVADLIGTDGSAHISVASVEQDAKVRVAALAHGVDQSDDLGRLVERKTRLELPANANPPVGGQLGTEVESTHRAFEDQF